MASDERRRREKRRRARNLDDGKVGEGAWGRLQPIEAGASRGWREEKRGTIATRDGRTQTRMCVVTQ